MGPLKGIIIAKYDRHLSDMGLKLWLIGEWYYHDVKFGGVGGYSLLDPVDVGDFVELYEDGGPIRKLSAGPTLPKTRLIDGANGTRSCLQVKVNFAPLDFLLFPSSAKAKNLRMAMSAELGPIPIAHQNGFKLHCFYRGVATLFFDKDQKQQMIEDVYKTPWLLKKEGASLVESDFSDVVGTYAFCQSQDVHRQGLVVDASLKDVFFVHCAELTEMVSLRKDITGGRIAVGDWIEFVSLDVREAEKSDDSQKIFPDDNDNMSFFRRSIACCPGRIDPPFPTSAGRGKTQLTVTIRVPKNPPHNGIYAVERLGNVGDPKGLIGLGHEGRTISVEVQCKVNIEQNTAAFAISGIEQPKSPNWAVPSAACHGTFLQNIEHGAQLQLQRQQQKQTFRLTDLTENTGDSGRKRTEGADENADPTDAVAFAGHGPQRRQPQEQPQHWPLSPLTPPPIPPPAPRRKPTNCIELETVVVEAVVGRGVHSPHVFCFCYDCSQKTNNYIIRIGLNEIDQLPTLGQWVRVVMKQEVHSKRVDYSLWEAETMGKPSHETDFTVSNGVRTVLVRVPLKVSGDGCFYSQFLGPVSDIGRRLKIPPGNERRQVTAWCQKVMPLNFCSADGVCHWEIAPLPEEEWQNEHPLQLPAESKTTFKIPFVGSRYRSQQQQQTTTAKEEGKLVRSASTAQPTPQPSQQQQIQQPMTISKPNQQQSTIAGAQRFDARRSPAMDSSGFGSSASSNSSAQAEIDLIDLFDKCSIGTLKRTPSPPPLRQQFSGVMYPHTGVIASLDSKSRAYYVYSNEFDNELYLSSEELLEKGSWIKFNILDTHHRLIIGDYSPLKRSPFDVRVERNTIYMCVSASVTPDSLERRVIDTSYVKKVYDRNRKLQPAHIGKELKLEVVRGKVDGFCWAISQILKIGN